MAASSKLMLIQAERRFPVRIRIGVPPEGLGSRLDQIRVWLDENCGAEGWALTPSGMRGVLNDGLSTPRERLRGPLVRGIQDRGCGGRIQGAGR
jgi:hypothetical protein